MRDTSIARNYAEALLALARKANDTAGWGATVSALGDAVERDATLRHFLEAPQVSATQKTAVLGKALAGAAPHFVRFVQKLVTNRRQMLLPEIAVEYHNLLDEAEGRVHARVTVARGRAQLSAAANGSDDTSREGRRGFTWSPLLTPRAVGVTVGLPY